MHRLPPAKGLTTLALCWLGGVCFFFSSSIPARDSQPPGKRDLTTASSLHELSARESAGKLPVKLRGIVTYNRGVGAEFTLQDVTGGVMLDWHDYDKLRALRPGTEVEIEGRTVTKPPTPRVLVDRLRVLGSPGLPPPHRASMAELLTEDLEGSLVEFTGVLRAVRVEGGVIPPRLTLEFGPAQSRLSVWVSRWDDDAKAKFQPGALIRARGVLMRWKTHTWLPFTTFSVAQDAAWISVLQPSTSPSSLPLRSLAEALESRADRAQAARVRVRGVVTLNLPADGMVLQEGNSALRVKSVSAPEIRPGDQVEAVGFLAHAGAHLELEDAFVTRLGAGKLPEIVQLHPADLAKDEPQWLDGHLVRIQAKVQQTSDSVTESLVWLEFGNGSLPVRLPPGKAEALPAVGSIVEASGVLNARLNSRILQTGRGNSTYELVAQAPDRIVVLRPATWWTEQRLFAALAIIVVLGSSASLWALALRRRVAEKSAQLEREITARHDQELLATERQRLARDLHDTLEQTLTGASLQLDAVEALAPDWDRSGPRDPLDLARRLLDRSRDELRRAVWDLTPGLLEEQGLPAALAMIAEEHSASGKVAVTVECTEEAISLPDRLAAHLCRVAQEATHNAIRHGTARQITISVTMDVGQVSLTVEDDGSGFNPEQVPGIESGHFGINGMKERMRRLGGRCAISSRKGEGTILLATCPAGLPSFDAGLDPLRLDSKWGR